MDQKKFNKLKNLIKQDNPSSFRLPSLKPPRDLSLGGIRPKRVFTPNLNVVRYKDEQKDTPKESFTKERSAPSPKLRNNNRNKNVKKNDQKDGRYVQSTGIFSHGSGELSNKIRYSNTSAYRDSRDAEIPIPKIKRDPWTATASIKTEDDTLLDDLMLAKQDNELSDDGLSIYPRDLKFKPSRIKLEDGTDVKIEDSMKDLKLDYISGSPFLNEAAYSVHSPHLSVMKLPSSFANKGLSNDPKESDKIFDYPLSDMLEGKIGKLCIRASGRMEVHIGNVSYELDDLDYSTSYEEAVCFTKDKDQEGDRGIINVLSDIQTHCMFTPYWDKLFQA